MKLLLERAGTMEWEIIGLFDEWTQEAEENDWDATREDWYDENEVRIREIPER